MDYRMESDMTMETDTSMLSGETAEETNNVHDANMT